MGLLTDRECAETLGRGYRVEFTREILVALRGCALLERFTPSWSHPQ